MKKYSLILLPLFLSACQFANFLTYSEAEHRSRQDCQKYVAMSDYQACMERFSAMKREVGEEKRRQSRTAGN